MKSYLLLYSLILSLQPFQASGQTLFQRMANYARSVISSDLLSDIPNRRLSNGVTFPLLGLGVGNMMPDLIPSMVSKSMQPDKKIYLFDTSNISQNELYVAKGIVEGAEILEKESEIDKVEAHVITKVWYTHLGYERTRYAVESSLKALKEAIDHKNVDLKLHVMIHWPRCYDNISWMNCELEENELPDEVKKLGPAPHLDKQNAWKESWRALETLVNDESNVVTSIGVSNFHLDELQQLIKIATVKPHVLETDSWSLLYSPLVVDFCHQHDIHVVSHRVMEGIIRKYEKAPFAYNHLLKIANELAKTMHQRGTLAVDEELSPAQVVLSWLAQHSISGIPKTDSLIHLAENSAVAIGNIPTLSEAQVETVSLAVEALISEKDLPEDAYVKVTFHANTKDVYLWWYDSEYGGEIQVAKIDKGDKWEESSHPGHIYRVYDSDEKKNYELISVDGKYGDHSHVEL